jgi:hypothetical protein
VQDGSAQTGGLAQAGPLVFDLEVIRSLAQDLRLTRPITIALKNGDLIVRGRPCTTTRGVHRNREGEHVIELKASLSPEDANLVLAHELFHCVQAERYGDKWASRYKAARQAFGYRRSHFEVSARLYADAIVRRGVRLFIQAASS